MSISVKDSLEHVCEVFNFFGIDYITAEVLRRGKNEKKLNRRKVVIIKLNLLINDLCLLYCFEFKRKFKPNYGEYIQKELLKLEETHLNDYKSSNKKRTDYTSQQKQEQQKQEQENEEDKESDNGEDCYNEELDEDVNYFEELHIISPLVVLLLEQFEYPRLYHLLKCNFQMAKELLLCIGFLIDAIKMFEHFDIQQPFYQLLFNTSDNASKTANRKNVVANIEKTVEPEFHYFINESMLFLSNRPYDIEIFECKYFHKFLKNLTKNIDETSPFSPNVESEKITPMSKKKEEKDEEVLKGTENMKEEADDDVFSLEEFVNYDYSKYQENFLNYYNKKKKEKEEKNSGVYEEGNNEYSNDEDEEHNINGEHVYTMEMMKNINKNCSQLLQLGRKIFLQVNQLQNYDTNRLMLFNRFNELITKYTEPHTITVNWNNSLAENYKTYKTVNKGKKVNLNNNVIFTVMVKDEEKEKIENKKISEQIHSGINQKEKNQEQTNTRNSYRSKNLTKGKNIVTDDNDLFNDINYELLNDRININEFYILNNTSLYNKIIHIYKNGLHFFHYEKLRAVFWLWLQSLFSEASLDYCEESLKEKSEKVHVTFNDINNNMFFFNNVAKTKDNDWLHLHILNDLDDFEKNYKLLKEYLKSKGCTTGYNKFCGSEKSTSVDVGRLEEITKYVQNLHLEFEAFFNYKKKSKNLNDEIFVEFLDDKKKNMVVNSNIEKEDYTNLANVVHKHLININKIKDYNPILNISKIVEGIKKQNYVKTDIDVSKIEMDDWEALYTYYKQKKDIFGSGKQNKDLSKRYIINLTNDSNYGIYKKPVTYASSIFQYSDQFITNNDVYTFSENLFKINEKFEDVVKKKQDKCTHNFFHILDKVEKYMDCVAFNL